MNHTNTSLLLGTLLCCGSILTAQFSADFTAAEGYADGALNDDANWVAGTADTFTLSDAAGTGIVTMGNGNFAKATYAGPGGSLRSNNYVATVVFTLDYSGDVNANTLPAAARLLARFEFGVAESIELTGAGIRQLVSNPGDFNVNLFQNLGGSANNLFEDLIKAEQLGLAISGAQWTDPVSDPLQLVHSLAWDGAVWTQSMTLTNLTTATELASATRTFADAGPFLAGNNTFLMNTGQTHLMPGFVVKVDKVTVNQVGFVPTWADYPLEPDGQSVDTGAFLGWLNVALDPWTWSYSLGKHIYLPEANVTATGAWTYIPR